MNPNHTVPVLEITRDDGSVQTMLESVAIIEWLADAFPAQGLAPAPGLGRERADYLQMMQFVGNWMDSLLWQLRLHRDLFQPDEVDQRTIDRASAKIAAEIEPLLLERLTASPYICGTSFSAADILTGHNVSWARAYGLCQDDRFATYLRRLVERPAYQQALDDVSR